MINGLDLRLGGILRGHRRTPAYSARVWSNEEIARIAPHVTGRVVNVSAWNDEDKQGRVYRSYFSGASSYETTNYEGWRGAGAATDDVLDLQSAAPDELVNRYDLVFNHTTLEHLFDIHQGFRTIASMSSDALLVVVPFMQHLHGPEDGDFWRPSPYAMRRFHADAGFTILREAAGPDGGNIRYLFYFASRFPERWNDVDFGVVGNAEAVLRQPL
jgi:hypothetical protein